jgi:hypothetical protein
MSGAISGDSRNASTLLRQLILSRMRRVQALCCIADQVFRNKGRKIVSLQVQKEKYDRRQCVRIFLDLSNYVV